MLSFSLVAEALPGLIYHRLLGENSLFVFCKQAIDIDLSYNQNLILATIYCPNGNHNLRLFETINNLSDNVIFVGDFNSKLEAFGCAKKNTSGPMLKTNQLNLIYSNTDEHTNLDKCTGNTDILDMAFISPNLSKPDIQFLIGDDLGSDHLPIEIAIDAPPHRNIHINPVRYKFNQTDREVFESTLEATLSSGDVLELKSTHHIGKYADFITTAISIAVDKAIPTSKSRLPESQPISEETLALIKEKHNLRRQYSQAHDPFVMHLSIVSTRVRRGGNPREIDRVLLPEGRTFDENIFSQGGKIEHPRAVCFKKILSRFHSE